MAVAVDVDVATAVEVVDDDEKGTVETGLSPGAKTRCFFFFGIVSREKCRSMAINANFTYKYQTTKIIFKIGKSFL